MKIIPSNLEKGDGEVFTWGLGDQGALGTGHKVTEWSPVKIPLDERGLVRVARISAGGRHTGFITGNDRDLIIPLHLV